MGNNVDEVFIGVGSNIDPERNIPDALACLSKHVCVRGISVFYRTTPLLRPDQDDFLNGVWRISTSIPPEELKFRVLRTIEKELHRNRESDRYAPRTIDLDLLLFGDLVIHDENVVIPDPDIYKREFIAIPLSELNPDLILPDTKIPLTEILSKLSKENMIPEMTFTENLRRVVNV
ncbi:7,8-dihydro-6-hydroxymethylpterin-pyrophosphokinase [Candidatus Scalindua japonica]|uniref:2-amino-4-hydroxy-6-hydroxymethyldihydropteridine pyrophosphokinase n=1 Tax=Candidatus Scalindua japonica TaxID=1284222 RepID=A0A286TWD7_9BACT|nr:2-amino-4-hydroxy-6-hydroxymethyldihydropteridine diphosphokinase [Candidatus Scalindua japonica]GAX60196.1 7,8-dihydro-6-hydroxymethylpterin-pyrophosphokinase [Candidatus Scalindua japonica]